MSAAVASPFSVLAPWDSGTLLSPGAPGPPHLALLKRTQAGPSPPHSKRRPVSPLLREEWGRRARVTFSPQPGARPKAPALPAPTARHGSQHRSPLAWHGRFLGNASFRPVRSQSESGGRRGRPAPTMKAQWENASGPGREGGSRRHGGPAGPTRRLRGD